ncbi:hypothetical protein ABK040_015145 [Willaertia magna]
MLTRGNLLRVLHATKKGLSKRAFSQAIVMNGIKNNNLFKQFNIHSTINYNNFSTNLFTRQQQDNNISNEEQLQQDAQLGSSIFQFIESIKNDLPLQQFQDMDKLLQALIFQSHHIYRNSNDLQQWKPVFYEMIQILFNNHQMFSNITPDVLSQVQNEIDLFKDSILNSFDKYINLNSSNKEIKIVGNYCKILTNDILVKLLPNIKFNQQLAMKHLDSTIQEMKNFLESDSLPKSMKVSILSRLSLSYLQKQNIDEALHYANEGIEIYPEFTPSYITRASIYTQMGETEKALKDCDTMLSYDPAEIDAYYCKANTYLRIQNLSKALESLDQLISIHPNHPSALAKRSGIHFGLKQYDRAIMDLERAANLNENNTQGIFTEVLYTFDSSADKYAEHLIIALFNKVTGNIVETMKSLDEAIKVDATQPTAYHQKGIINFNMLGNTEDALIEFDKAIQHKDKATSELFLGTLFQDKGLTKLNVFVSRFKNGPPETIPTLDSEPELKEAFDCLQEAVNYLPKSFQLKALTSIGSIYVIMDENDAAVEEFNKAIDSSKEINEALMTKEYKYELAAVYFNRGHVEHTKLKKFDEAIQDYTKAIQLYPANPLFYHFRSLVYIIKGEDEKAKKDTDMEQKITKLQQQRLEQYNKMKQQNPQ